MTQTISSHFDGRVIIPDEPLQLPPGQRLRVEIETLDADRPPFANLASYAADLPDAPPDLSEQHDHYLSGTPRE